MCKHTIVNTCYISLGMGVRKVSNSKSDHQGHREGLKVTGDGAIQ